MWTLAQNESGEWVKGYMEEEKENTKKSLTEREGANVEVAGWDPGSAVGGQWNKASKLSKTPLTGNFRGSDYTEPSCVCHGNRLQYSWL